MIKSAQFNRRYYARPILLLVAFVFFWQTGHIPAGLETIGRTVRTWAATSGAGNRAADREGERRQIEKIQMALATTQAMLELIQKQQAKQQGEYMLQQLEQGHGIHTEEAQTITITGTNLVKIPPKPIPEQKP